MKKAIGPFLKSVAWGALAGGAPFALFIAAVMVMKGLAEGGIALYWIALFALLPIAVALAYVLAAMLLIGLPLTWLLHRANRESRAAYILAGTIAGMLIPLVHFAGPGAWPGPSSLILAFCGALGGGTTGHCWWNEARRPGPPRCDDESA